MLFLMFLLMAAGLVWRGALCSTRALPTPRRGNVVGDGVHDPFSAPVGTGSNCMPGPSSRISLGH